ncbi:MAG: 4-hydroxybutyryl-CoA dehydratase/vinylacetyl-CoA-Delta-isomerase [Verrucomicrobia subdivision 3 bacterium]|nr:4-hydroxybutyryl-CoA dehydratase/vinylacetyl-CoA-Delta-isomerase [Limisphaerales bacterium]MCS1414046.1 4-hydroxybutyryl-CoA dehydratase/vinylacetyl-CoA-Delta-isomerase [Limisphaerales bacterium]
MSQTTIEPSATGQSEKRTRIETGADYIDSLRDRELVLYYLGERITDPVEHPVIRPSINAIAATYDLAISNPELALVTSPFTQRLINRFLHIATSQDDLAQQNKMQRKLGQLTGTCFLQRCVGMDALNALLSVTYGIDAAHSTAYHDQLNEFIRLTVMPTMCLGVTDKDFAIVGALPVETSGIAYIYGSQSCDTRSLERGDLDSGNAHYSGQEDMVIFKDVFIPRERIFMHGEVEFASLLVECFTCYHRRSYVCKSGVGDVLIGAATIIANYNGVSKVSHIREKPVEMTHLNETIYSTGIASSHQSRPTQSGCYLNDDMIANVCKHHVTRTHL